MNPMATPIPRRLRRVDAANLLRRARQTLHGDACESIRWAYCAMPERRAAQRLKIDHLLHIANYEAADALLARTLMQQEDHPLMRLRYAQSLVAQGRATQAHIEVMRVLKSRSHCCRAHLLAARIARSLGDHLAAESHLAKARSLRPSCAAIRETLVRALLESGHVEDAAAEFHRMVAPSAMLSATVLRAQGRILDAIDVLRTAVRIEAKPQIRDDLLSQLIHALEDAGDTAGRKVAQDLNELTATISAETPASAIALARAMLASGSWSAAADLADRTASVPQFKRTASLIRTIAGHQHHQSNLEKEHATQDPDAASLWLTSMLGRLIHEIESGRDSGADPQTSVLQPMLREAVATFDAQLATPMSETGCRAIEHHRNVCRTAMGLPQQVQCETLVPNAPGLDQHSPANAETPTLRLRVAA